MNMPRAAQPSPALTAKRPATNRTAHPMKNLPFRESFTNLFPQLRDVPVCQCFWTIVPDIRIAQAAGVYPCWRHGQETESDKTQAAKMGASVNWLRTRRSPCPSGSEVSMGFRFRRTIKILPVIRLNVGKRGVSTSIGVRGAHVTVGRTGRP